MTRLSRILMTVAIAATSTLSAAEAEPRIANYLGDRAGAISFTFDDGFRSEVNDTLEIIDPLGIQGTFFLIPEVMGGSRQRAGTINWEEARALHAKGHELGTHGLINPRLHEVDAATLERLVNGSRQAIINETGVTPVSYALPGGTQFTGPVQAKILENHYFVREPTVLPNARILRYGNAGRRQWDDEKTRQTIRQAMARGEWVIPVVHSIVGGYAPFKSKAEFRGHCEWVKSQEDQLWIAPMGTVGRYAWQRDHAKLRVSDRIPTAIRFTIESDLDDPETFNSVLTVVIPARGARSVVATNAQGQSLHATARDDAILVDVPVDAGAVTVQWQ